MPELAVSDLDEAVAQVADLWESLRGGNVFLTGGTGFIGTWLVEVFLRVNATLNLGARATILTRDPARFWTKAPHVAENPSIRLFQGDVYATDFPHQQFTHVIHAAADASRSSSQHEFDTILSGTRRVLDFCRTSHVTNVLFLSSGAVYGPQPHDVPLLAEDYRFAPLPGDLNATYAEAKRGAEALCTIYAAQNGMRICIARCFAFIGPHLPLDGPFAAGNFIRDAIKGEPIAVRGHPDTIRSYLYAGDLAAWLWTMLLSPRASGIYNVGSHWPVTIADLAKMVSAAGSVPVQFSAASAATPSRYVPSIDRARKELGLDVRVPVDEAIRRTLHWYSQNSIMNETPSQDLTR